jgi:hypothetical protein
MKSLRIILLLISTLFSQERVMIEGKSEYKYSDNETLIEAKSLCYNMALRNAVESYNIFVSSMTDVHNFQLRNDIIQTLSSGYLEDLTVVEENVDRINNSIYYKLRAYIRPEPFKKALKQEVARKINFVRPDPIMKGHFIEIIDIRESSDGDIDVLYKKTNKYFENSVYDKDYVMIDFFDNDGFPMSGDKNGTTSKLLIGEIRRTSFEKPASAKSYRVWVTQR